jgi:ectoine hydrolase
VLVEEVNAVWQRVLKRHGYIKVGRSGYSIGVGFPPSWNERTVSIRSGDRTVLQGGMCFHFQSGVRLERFGAAISESFVVTERGGERLADVDRRLIVVN